MAVAGSVPVAMTAAVAVAWIGSAAVTLTGGADGISGGVMVVVAVGGGAAAVAEAMRSGVLVAGGAVTSTGVVRVTSIGAVSVATLGGAGVGADGGVQFSWSPSGASQPRRGGGAAGAVVAAGVGEGGGMVCRGLRLKTPAARLMAKAESTRMRAVTLMAVVKRC